MNEQEMARWAQEYSALTEGSNPFMRWEGLWDGIDTILEPLMYSEDRAYRLMGRRPECYGVRP